MEDIEYDDYDRSEEMRYEAEQDMIGDDDDEYDEYQEHGFIDSADYWRWKGF